MEAYDREKVREQSPTFFVSGGETLVFSIFPNIGNICVSKSRKKLKRFFDPTIDQISDRENQSVEYVVDRNCFSMWSARFLIYVLRFSYGFKGSPSTLYRGAPTVQNAGDGPGFHSWLPSSRKVQAFHTLQYASDVCARSLNDIMFLGTSEHSPGPQPTQPKTLPNKPWNG